METFKINTTIDGQTVEATGCLTFRRHASLTMTAPYFPIEILVFALDENNEIRQFYDFDEVKEYAEKGLQTVMRQISYVKQYRKEYTQALNLYESNDSRYIAEFNSFEENQKRGSLSQIIELHNKALGEYTDLLCKLIPVTTAIQIINPSLLSQILRACFKKKV